MPRWLKISLKIAGSLIALVFLLWFGVALYVHMNKASLLKQITAQLNEDLNGTLTIKSMEPTLIRGFPGISISLNDVVLRDSFYASYGHNLLEAKFVYVSVNAFSILKGAPRIRNIRINQGNIYVFTDSTGYSNTSIFKKNNTGAKKEGDLRINHVFLNDVVFTFENRAKFKLFNLNIDKMETLVNYNDTGWTAEVEVLTLVKSFAFNTQKGSFLKDKTLDIDINIGYNRATQALSIPNQRIHINKDAVDIGGKFSFGETPAAFLLDIGAKDIVFKDALALLSPSISGKLSIIDIKDELDVHASLQGFMKFRDTPTVRVTWLVKDNTLVTPAGEIKDCSFSGLFMNEIVPGAGHNDQNSRVSVYGLEGNWQEIPFSADTVNVSNLVKPVIEGQFQSRFPLAALNPIIGGNTFTFNKGNVALNLLYKGGVLATDTTIPYIYGTVQVSNAAMTYLPRSLSFTNASALVKFHGSDVSIQDVNVTSGTTVLKMNGSVRNFLNLYYTDPSKMLLDWNISSPKIDLNEFIAFLGKRKSGGERVKTNDAAARTTKMSEQLDKVLEVSSVRLRLNVAQLIYKKFTAAKVNADVQLGQSGITLNNISLNNAGGRVALHGSLDQKGSVNDFHVESKIENVHVNDFFTSFDNFGQDAITNKNVKGSLFADIDMKGSISDDGSMMPKSLYGSVDFDLRNAALVNFEPFQKISKYIFRNRNLANVTFTNFKNKIEINGDKITINPMLLESSALNMHIRGIYSLSTGTNIDIDVPLRNPKKDELILDDSLKLERSMKGIVVHLKAVDGNDGNVKFQLMRKKQETDEEGMPEKKKTRTRRRDRAK